MIDFSKFIQNLHDVLPSIYKLATGFTFFAGIGFAFRSVMLFAEYGKARTLMAHNADIKRPLICMMLAIVLLYWQGVLHDIMMTVLSSDQWVTSYNFGISDNYQKLINYAGNIFQLIGYIGFVRGWILLARIGQQGAQPGAFAKAISHIVGGLFAVNIFTMFKVLNSLVS